MKVVAKSIDMLAWFEESGTIHPIRFRLKNEDGAQQVIKVDRICSKELEKFAGNPMLVFKCQSFLNGALRPYEIKYELETRRWILFKI